MTISDGYGDAPVVDDLLADAEGWLAARARALCSSAVARSRIDDVKQEGRIALWRHLRDTGDTEQAFAQAFYRMKAVAWGQPRLTGMAPREAHTVAHDEASIDALVEYGVWDMFAGVEALTDVEIAYHRGEIMQAFRALTPKQQQYVYARFWCGIDMPAGSRNEGVKAAKDANPVLRRDVLWTGNKTTTGAKQRLADRLAHLRELVASA